MRSLQQQEGQCISLFYNHLMHYGWLSTEYINWKIGTRQSPFNVDLNDYGFFDNKFHPVVYLNVTRTDQLSFLHLGTRKMIIKEAPYLRGRLNASFNPHLTIGYRDISPEIFPTIKEEYSQYKFNTTFEADHITFFIHDRKQWNVLYEFPFLGTDNGLRSISKQGNLF